MATVDISTGVQMKQRQSKRYEEEEGGGEETPLVRGYNEPWGGGGVKLLQGEKKPLQNHFKLFGFLSVLICHRVWVNLKRVSG